MSSRYLDILKEKAEVSNDVFYNILLSHVLNPGFMYKDDFSNFIKDRKEKILQRIKQAMGKNIPRDHFATEEGDFFQIIQLMKINRIE